MKETYKKEEVRIVQDFWRDRETGSVKSNYKVEYLEKGLFGKLKWYPFCRSIGYGDYEYWEIIDFPTLKKAEKFRDSLLQPVPKQKIY